MTAIIERNQSRGVGRVPPHSREAEESVLGALLLSPHAANEVMDKLVPLDFYVPAHQSIFEAMVTLYNANQPIDAVTLSEELRRSAELDKVGGLGYLTHLVDVVPTASNVEYYGGIVEEHGLRRSLIKAGSTITDLAFRTDDEVMIVIDRAEQEVLAVAEKRAGDGMVAVGPLFQEAIEHIEALEANGSELTGLATGFVDLDKKLAGLQKANLVVIAGRPSMGKCLAEGTNVVDANTGTRHKIEDLYRQPDLFGSIAVLALDDAGKLVSALPSAIADNGVKQVFRVKTRLGREVVATANHPLLTFGGWRRVDQISVGDQIAVARSVDVSTAGERSDAEVAVLGYLIGDGSVSSGRTAVKSALLGLAESDVIWDPIVSIEPVGMRRTFDLEVPKFENFVADDVIVHNSALTLNVATHIAGAGKVVAIFSLEMAKEEVVQRILSSVGKVESSKLRTGQLGNQWDRLVSAANRMYKTPIYVDDSSVVMVTDIRAKCRRLKRVKGLDLVVVDYLQLMQGSTRENRQQEIAEISRGLKNLARELEVPIIAVSQLNRSVETREDRRPRLSDLRECLAAETEIVRSDNGQSITIGEIARQGLRDVPVWSLDSSLKIVASVMSEAWSTGVKPVFKVTTSSGRVIRATSNHPLLTVDGWKQVGELAPGHRIGVPRRIPEPLQAARMATDEMGFPGRGLGLLQLERPSLALIAGSDVLWDSIVSIEPDGEEEVFDAAVPSGHNFIASLVFAHNSGALEQDADVVVFIYRHEYYHPDDIEKRGTAEIIIAKHRAGATGTVEMTFMPDFTRFADLGRDLA